MFIRSIKLLAYLIGFYKQVQLSYYSKRQRIHLRICVRMTTWLYYNNMFFGFQFSFQFEHYYIVPIWFSCWTTVALYQIHLVLCLAKHLLDWLTSLHKYTLIYTTFKFSLLEKTFKLWCNQNTGTCWVKFKFMKTSTIKHFRSLA